MALDVAAYYSAHGPMVLRRCKRMLHDEEQALDAMHDVFVKLLRYEDRLRDEAPSSLLYRMATNECLNRIRGQKRRPETAEGELLARIASFDDLEGRAHRRSLLDRIFSREQESTGTIAVLHLVDGMTLEEVAQEVGMSVSGVRKRLRTLKARVAEQELSAL